MKRFEGFMHGIDLGGWLSQGAYVPEHWDTFITEEDFRRIAGWGLDHVRLPVDYIHLQHRDLSWRTKGFATLQNAVDWAGRNGLNLVLDLHKAAGFSFDDSDGEAGFFESEALQERFYELWEELAGRFGSLSDRVAFELLNEVTSRSYMDAWNRIARECIRRIRRIAPDVKVLIGGSGNNSVYSLEALDPPADGNVVYNFHFYHPFPFTHQGAHWVDWIRDFRTKVDLTYGEYRALREKDPRLSVPGLDGFPDGEILGAAYFERIMAMAAGIAEKRGVALYCGEYGVIDRATPEDALKWYRMISPAFDRFGIGRAAWTYKQKDFGLTDDRMRDVFPEILKCL